LYQRYSTEKLNACLAILKASRTYEEAQFRIAAEVDPRLDARATSKLFRRHGLETPSSYIQNAFTSAKVSTICPPAPTVAAGVVSFGGVAPRVQRAYSGQLLRVLIIPDVHVPYHCPLAWNTALAVGRGWRPDVGVILGDFADFYQVSQYAKDPKRKIPFDQEVTLVLEEMERFAALRIPRVIACEGNHETRFSRMMANDNPALSGVPGIASDARQLLDVQKRFGWEWVPYGHHASVGKLNFMHDAGHAGMYAAKQSVAAFGASIVFGHTHRAGAHYESTVNGDRHVGWTMGWLGDPECIDYKHRARVLRENQHGIGLAYVEESTGLFWVHFAPIISGRVVVDGVVYDGRTSEAA
jgi:predicted phosphodiesterase